MKAARRCLDGRAGRSLRDQLALTRLACRYLRDARWAADDLGEGAREIAPSPAPGARRAHR